MNFGILANHRLRNEEKMFKTPPGKDFFEAGTPPEDLWINLMRSLRRYCRGLVLLLSAQLLPCLLVAQGTGALSGEVFDSTGALVPGATITLTHSGTVLTTRSSANGHYRLLNIPLGSYQLTADASGFTRYVLDNVEIARSLRLNIPLTITDQEQVTVTSDAPGVSLDATQNASATVLKGRDLDALSDDPNQLMTDLSAFAGPSAGPGGGDLYVDGFSGGRLPPKSSIREIRINQNPFSSEFDRSGYGRIEILTKPGAQKLSGSFGASYVGSTLNTAIPLSSTQPNYRFYWVEGDAAGPISKRASFFVDYFRFERQNQNTYNAINPADTTASLSGTFPNPDNSLYATARLDLQAGQNQTLSLRGYIFRDTVSGGSVGGLNLPQQSSHNTDPANNIQLSDTIILGPHLLDEINFEWKHERETHTPDNFLPTINVQGSFVNGGNTAHTANFLTNYEFQNYMTATAGKHVMRFGVRLRANDGTFTSASGTNGSYFFQTLAQYEAGKPYLYTATVVHQPTTHILMFDAAFFFQDDWRLRPNLNLGYGLRVEGQNRIHDRADWAPRLALSWSPKLKGSAPAKTVLRAGYGFFYERFTIPSFFNGGGGTPYLLATIQNNGVNQQNYVVQNPSFYDPTTPIAPGILEQTNSSTPTIYTLARHFHAALNMQGSLEVDRQLTKHTSLSLNYLYTRGIHQYLTNNITAADFDPSTYTVTGPTPTLYNYQFQSGGTYKQHQLIVTTTSSYKKLSMHATYVFNHARSDTQGVSYFPSIAGDPGFDYGRAHFDIRHQLNLVGTYTGPLGITIAPHIVAQSGTPYNITIGNDLTGNNQSNARPTYGRCGATDVVSTQYGCFDTNPVGKREAIIPYNLGTGPANVVVGLRLMRKFGIGPRQDLESELAGAKNTILTTNTAPLPPRKYAINFILGTSNLFNIVNLGPPNGTLSSPLFGKSQTLAAGPFELSSPGNRTVYVNAIFSF